MNEDSLMMMSRGETLFEGLPNDVFRPVDRSWSRDTAVACFCCCDGAGPAATELMLRAARVPPRGAAASLLVPRGAAPRGEDDQLSARL